MSSNIKAMKNTWVAATLLTVAGIIGIAAAMDDVSTEYDKSFDFATIKTFSAKIATPWGNPIMESSVLKEIEDGLSSRGWQKVPEGEADAEVLIHGSTQQKDKITTFYNGGYYGGWGWYGYWGGPGMTTVTTHTYTEGTLVVDIFNTRTKQLVWRGTIVDELKKKQDHRQKQIEKSSDKLFKYFPPGPDSER
jgi:uncharacterized protein DUF4136